MFRAMLQPVPIPHRRDRTGASPWSRSPGATSSLRRIADVHVGTSSAPGAGGERPTLAPFDSGLLEDRVLFDFDSARARRREAGCRNERRSPRQDERPRSHVGRGSCRGRCASANQPGSPGSSRSPPAHQIARLTLVQHRPRGRAPHGCSRRNLLDVPVPERDTFSPSRADDARRP